jgi:hypothetical protein
MRDNSGSGKGKNNMRDPTMRDREGGHRLGDREGRDFTEESALGKTPARDEKTSPSDRARGETASSDKAAAIERSR